MKDRRQDMIPAQRRKLILDVICDQGTASVQQLSDRIGASLATIRRDLDLLAGENLIIRSHGGASRFTTAETTGQHWMWPQAAEPPSPARRALGVAAANRVEEGQHVIFDSGLGSVEAAQRIVERQISITAVTNSIKVSSILAQSDLIHLVVLGGTRRPGTWTLTGEPGQGFLEGLNADIALMSIQAVAGGRLWHNSLEIASMKRRLIQAARHPILLVESWKFGGPAFCEVCSMSEIAEVMTDSGISEADRQSIQKSGATLSVVAPADEPQRTSSAETAAFESSQNAE
jgi:DeoR family transcriptional regulator, aga operon transcriptional repressor